MKKKATNFFKSFKINSKSYLKTNILFMTFVLTTIINGMLLRFLTVKNYFAKIFSNSPRRIGVSIEASRFVMLPFLL